MTQLTPDQLQRAMNEQANAPLVLAKHTRFYVAKDIAAGLSTSTYEEPWKIAQRAFAIVDALVDEANK
jgi:hypothetical protein